MSKKIKIGLLADSHQKKHLHNKAIRHLLEEGAQYLLHAGDLEIKENLDALAAPGLPYVCVYGNNDTALIPYYGQYPIYREPHYFNVETIKIKMMHMPYYLTPDADIVISAHTHKFEAYKRGETLFINPGEVCAREKFLSECAMIEVSDEQMYVTYFSREPDQEHWDRKEVLI